MSHYADINLLLTEREGRTGEYWPEVVTVRTEHREVRTKTTEGQYSPVRLEQARLVSSLSYGTRHTILYGRTSSAWWSKQLRKNKLPRLTTLKKKLMTPSERFTSISYGFHFWIGSQSVGITFTIQFFQVQLDWSRRILSLPIEHLFGFVFVNRPSCFHFTFALCFDSSFLFDF